MSSAPIVDRTVTPGEVATGFFDAIRARDVDAAFGLVASDVAVNIRPAGLSGGYDVAHRFFVDVITAFPDLLLPTKRTIALADGRVLCELTFEGTQAGEFLGVINQEKHVDIEQAWLLEVRADQIVAITAYWDQNKLYRRLAVKRLDQIAIVS